MDYFHIALPADQLRTVSSIGMLDEAKLRRVLGHNREMEGCIVEAYPKG